MKRSSRKINSVAVFCASSFGNEHEFVELATNVGKHLALEGVTIIFGGSDAGLMGAVANGAISQDGQVIGVYPEDTFSRDVRHRGGVDLRLVSSMHERKATMYELSDGVIALPGGYGTLDELAEVLAWTQLGLHHLPVVLLDTGNFWNKFVEFLDDAVSDGVLNSSSRQFLGRAINPESALQLLRTLPLSTTR
ncbi:MAG: TIGR00730 family Rossman fold protein [Actinomycetota bacterium]|nr:TIGR00730 family Rossman fold protein [Acidimicrobiales bacterium]MEE2806235.1 TIGR00730 family Rossman fold protein [Actinomycetota bacterium]|tara:strand:+ start:4020 stop:4598 length:579 start_codon:yes stop_codon:yes gene_type:complete